MNTEQLRFKIAGTPYENRQDILRRIFSVMSSNIPVDLKRENNNQYDEFAVSILKNNEKLGYVPRYISQIVSENLQFLIDSKMDIFEDNDLLCANVTAIFGE